jgi:hypothetical protein
LTRRLSVRAFHLSLWPIILLGALALPRWAIANGGDLPPEIVVQAFVKPDEARLHLLVRFPLVLLSSFSLPKRGPGFLDLAHIDDRLNQAATAAGHQIELFDDGVPLIPTMRGARIALLSDHSFASYSAALAHFQAPPLPLDTELFWNQGFFDTELEYTLQSSRPLLAIQVNVAPELGERLKLRLEYLPIGEPARNYQILGASGRIPLDPRWYETAWLFLKGGFVDAFAIDRLVFLACLVAPFRKFRSLLAVVMILAGLQALTLTAVAEGALAGVDVGWLPALNETALALSIVLLAIGNLAAPSLRRRWFIVAVIGALGGFGLGRLLTDIEQFAGTHAFASVLSFNVGIALGELVTLAIAIAALRLLFACVRGPLLGVIVLSAVLGHVAWHWMLDGGHELAHQLGHAAATGLSSALRVVALWLVPLLLVGIAGYFLPKRFDGVRGPSLLDALLGRSTAQSYAPTIEP